MRHIDGIWNGIWLDAKYRQDIRMEIAKCKLPLDHQQHTEGYIVNIVTGRVQSTSTLNVH